MYQTESSIIQLQDSVPSPQQVQGPVNEFCFYDSPKLQSYGAYVACTLTKQVKKEWQHRGLWSTFMFLTSLARIILQKSQLLPNFLEVGRYHLNISAIHIDPERMDGIPIQALQNPTLDGPLLEHCKLISYKDCGQATQPQIVRLMDETQEPFVFATFHFQRKNERVSFLCWSPLESDTHSENHGALLVARKFSVLGPSSWSLIERSRTHFLLIDVLQWKLHTFCIETQQSKEIPLQNETQTDLNFFTNTCTWTKVPVDQMNCTWMSIAMEKTSLRLFLVFLKDRKIWFGKRPLSLSNRIKNITSLSNLNLETVLLGANVANDTSMVFHIPWKTLLEYQ